MKKSLSIKIHPTAEVEDKVKIGKQTVIWHQAQIREGTTIGENCIIGKGVYVDKEVEIGEKCKLENYCSIFHGAKIEKGVFIGPGALILNDKYPRAITPQGKLKSDKDWRKKQTLIKTGSSIGAGAIILPGITVGEYALIGAASVVTHDIPPYSLVYGNPARIMGKVNKKGKVILKTK